MRGDFGKGLLVKSGASIPLVRIPQEPNYVMVLFGSNLVGAGLVTVVSPEGDNPNIREIEWN